jgi:hypothetical protein
MGMEKIGRLTITYRLERDTPGCTRMLTTDDLMTCKLTMIFATSATYTSRLAYR